MNYNEACERAEEQIRDELKSGAVEQYISGDSAQEYLGELIRLNSQRREIGEDVQDWLRRISVDLDAYISRIIAETIEANVARVAQENAE